MDLSWKTELTFKLLKDRLIIIIIYITPILVLLYMFPVPATFSLPQFVKWL